MKAVIFDCDGMLNTEIRFSKRLAQYVPLEISLPFFKGPFQDCLVGRADLKEELAKVVKHWGWKESVTELMNFWFADEANIFNDAFFPIMEDLRRRGVSIYLATNNEKYRTKYLLETRGLVKLFDSTFSSSIVGYKKPQKEFYEYMLAHIPERKENVLYWDDDAEHIAISEGFGMPSRLYTTFDDFVATMNK